MWVQHPPLTLLPFRIQGTPPAAAGRHHSKRADGITKASHHTPYQMGHLYTDSKITTIPANRATTRQNTAQPCRASLCCALSARHQLGAGPLKQGSQDQSHQHHLRFCFPAQHEKWLHALLWHSGHDCRMRQALQGL